MPLPPYVAESPQYQASGETIRWSVDVTAQIPANTTPASPTATLVRLDTGVAVPASLSGAAGVVGNVVSQTVTALTAGVSYRLALAYQAGGDTLESAVVLICPF